MCGIAGIIKTSPAPWLAPRRDLSALHAVSDALAHRGPDGHGLWLDPRPNTSAALIHRRLAIIDQPGGGQPMGNEDGSVQVVFNGEIYNHLELRRELQAVGHHFATDHSDTEVLIHGWEQWSTDLPTKLLGMFAFAIWDTRIDPSTNQPRDTLFLARDRMGQKPLFYAPLDDGLIFASTLPALLAWPEKGGGVPRRVPRELLALYLQLGFLPAPHTIYRDISQLAPAHWLRLRGDVLDGNRYWSPSSPIDDPIDSAPPIKNQKSKIKNPHDALRAELSRAVTSQLIADTPIACFLSGGIDSSIIAALMQQAVHQQGGPPIRTVSVGFAESSFDETAYAAAVAKQIGSDHTRLEVHPHQAPLETLAQLMQNSLGQPFADSSILPTWHLSRAVRQLAPVALSGDGADELFGGYDRYRAMSLLSRWSGVLRLMPKAAPLGSSTRAERYRRLASAARQPDPADRYTALLEIFPPDLLADLLPDTVPPPMNNEQSPINNPPSSLRYAMLRDQLEYLPGDVLWKVDSASMLEALEVRSPFLDHHIIEFANSLDDSALIQSGRGKAILRQTFAAELPPLIQSRAKKGFAIPIGDWFKTDLRAPLTDLLFSSNSFTTTHLHPPAARQLLEEHLSGARAPHHTHRLFSLLMLELWHHQFPATIEG